MGVRLGGSEAENTGTAISVLTEHGEATRVLCETEGEATELAVKLSGVTGATNLRMALHEDNAGSVGAVLAEGVKGSAPVVGTNTVAIGGAHKLVKGSFYWVSSEPVGGTVKVAEPAAPTTVVASSTGTASELKGQAWNTPKTLGPLSMWVSGNTGTYTREAADTITITEGVSRVTSAPRAAADALAVTDAPVVNRHWAAAAADTIALAETPVRATGTARSVLERGAGAYFQGSIAGVVFGGVPFAGTAESSSSSLSITENARVSGRERQAVDAVTVTESAARTTTVARGALDALALAESTSRTRSSASTATDTVTIASAATRLLARARAAVDAVVFAESSTRASVVARAAADTIVVSESATRSRGSTSTTSDTVTLTTASSRVAARARSAFDALAVTEGGIVIKPSTKRPAGLTVTLPGTVTLEITPLGV